MQKQHDKTVHLRCFPFTDSFKKQLDFANIHSLFISFLGILSLWHWKDAQGMASDLQTHLIQADLSEPGQEYPVTKSPGDWRCKGPSCGQVSLLSTASLHQAKPHSCSNFTLHNHSLEDRAEMTVPVAQVGNRGSERLHHLSKVRGLRPGHTTVW